MVGAGYIAIEIAGIFNSLGCDTSMLIRHDKVSDIYGERFKLCLILSMLQVS